MWRQRLRREGGVCDLRVALTGIIKTMPIFFLSVSGRFSFNSRVRLL